MSLDLDGAEHAPNPARRLVNGMLEPPYGHGLNLQIEARETIVVHARVQAMRPSFCLPLEERWHRRANDEVGVHQFVVADLDGNLLRSQEGLGTPTTG